MAIVSVSTSVATGGPVYPGSPDWVSSDTPVSTGGALADMNNDGWLDLVVSNGNDISQESLAIYFNDGAGAYPDTPDWESDDHAYNGHLSLADVNGDGWMDVAVAALLNLGGPGAKVYLNNGGTLSATPDWECDEVVGGFHVDFGDVNGDGRPDLAMGTGWPYDGVPNWSNKVWLNVNGELETTASWVSNDIWDYDDIFWCDVDHDGWLDLVGTGSDTFTWVYVNDAGELSRSAIWQTMDNGGQFSVMGTYGDVTGDGLDDLIVTDNTQLFGGNGEFRLYAGLASGFFTQTPTWSYFDGYGSAVALADVDADNKLDLATGAWWDHTRIFLNENGALPDEPTWNSTHTSVIEAIAFGDVNGDGIQIAGETYTSTSDAPVFLLARQPIEGVVSVTVDGTVLATDQFFADRVHGWVSVGVEVADSLTVVYAYSRKPDMVVTNWDGSLGNYLYYNINDLPPLGDDDGDCHIDLFDYAAFQVCVSGPIEYAAFGCERFDFNADGHVDLFDAGEFQARYTGPDESVPGCVP